MGEIAQLSAETLQAQLANGLVLLALGMGVVFVFLTLLVFTTKGVSSVVRKIEKGRNSVSASQPQLQGAAVCDSDVEVAIAIAASVRESGRSL
ncbi:MAG: OadG family protein [Spirochaetales bacterium]|nr:OadG family protein [Spirochaetales bacterium]